MTPAALVAASIGAASAIAQPSFQGVGDLPGGAVLSFAMGVSADGAVVVGHSYSAAGSEAFRWTSGGMVNLGRLSQFDMFSGAAAVSGHGEVVVGASGYALSPFECRAVRWSQPSGIATLGGFGASGVPSTAHAVSADGSVIVGQASEAPIGVQAFRWTELGAVGLGTLPGGPIAGSAANGVSGDGAVVVGHAQSADLATEAFRWTSPEGMVGLGFLNASGFRDSRARAVSGSGTSVIVGESTSPNGDSEAFRWTLGGGMTGLGDLAGGVFRSGATAVSADGATVVGSSEAGAGSRAFIWTAATGMRDLRDVLIAQGLDLTGWTLSWAGGTSADGQVIVGWGVNPGGQNEGWVAHLACYANCDASTTPPVLNVGDFTCFLNRFAAACP